MPPMGGTAGVHGEALSSAEDPLIHALLYFQKWVGVLYHHGLARRSPNGVIEVAPPIARRFCIGFSNTSDCILVGALREEMAWARRMPWSHAAIYRGRNTIHLVTDRAEYDGGTVSPFAVAFDCDNQLARDLESYGTLQLRAILSRRPGTAAAELSKTAEGHMPFYVLEQDEDVMDIGGRRGPKKSAGMGA